MDMPSEAQGVQYITGSLLARLSPAHIEDSEFECEDEFKLHGLYRIHPSELQRSLLAMEKAIMSINDALGSGCSIQQLRFIIDELRDLAELYAEAKVGYLDHIKNMKDITSFVWPSCQGAAAVTWCTGRFTVNLCARQNLVNRAVNALCAHRRAAGIPEDNSIELRCVEKLQHALCNATLAEIRGITADLSGEAEDHLANNASDILDESCFKWVADVMAKYPEHGQLQAAACTVISLMCGSASAGALGRVVTSLLLRRSMAAALAFQKDVQLQSGVCAAMSSLLTFFPCSGGLSSRGNAVDDGARCVVPQEFCCDGADVLLQGGDDVELIELTVSAARRFPEDADIQALAFEYAANFCAGSNHVAMKRKRDACAAGVLALCAFSMNQFASHALLQRHACAAAANICLGLDSNGAARKQAAVSAGLLGRVAVAMRNFNESADLQGSACSCVRDICAGVDRDAAGRRDAVVSSGLLDLLAAAMQMFCTDEKVQSDACAAVRNVCSGSDDGVLSRNQAAAAADLLDLSGIAMSRSPRNIELQRRACGAVANICLGVDKKGVVRKQSAFGAGPLIVEAMRAFPSDVELHRRACAAITNICLGEDALGEARRQVVAAAGAFELIAVAMRRFFKDASLVRHACSALAALCLGGSTDDAVEARRETAANVGVLEITAAALQDFPLDAELQASGWTAIGNICLGSGEAAEARQRAAEAVDVPISSRR